MSFILKLSMSIMIEVGPLGSEVELYFIKGVNFITFLIKFN